jgi:hypothetical protein
MISNTKANATQLTYCDDRGCRVTVPCKANETCGVIPGGKAGACVPRSGAAPVATSTDAAWTMF